MADAISTERAIIDAIEAQFDIHALDPEDWAEMHCAISAALARQPQLPSNDGLIKALENLIAWSPEGLPRDAAIVALSRHKAPLSVAGDDVERWKLKCGEALNALDRIYGVTLTNNSPAGKLLSIESIVTAALHSKQEGEGQ